MKELNCIKCGADISDLPARCPDCGHGYSYELEQPPLGFWASFWQTFRRWFIVPVGVVLLLGWLM